MGTEESLEKDQHHEESHSTEESKPARSSKLEASANSEEISAVAGENRDQTQGSGDESNIKEGNSPGGTVTAAPNKPLNAPIVDEDDEDSDEDSDEEGFPRSEDVPRGRVVGPVAGQRPPKPR